MFIFMWFSLSCLGLIWQSIACAVIFCRTELINLLSVGYFFYRHVVSEDVLKFANYIPDGSEKRNFRCLAPV